MLGGGRGLGIGARDRGQGLGARGWGPGVGSRLVLLTSNIQHLLSHILSSDS